MNEKHRKFAQNIANGMKNGEAVIKAGYATSGVAASVAANRLLKNAKIIEYIKELSQKAENDKIASSADIKEGLTRMLKKAERESNYAGYAALSARLAKMSGHDEPERQNLNVEVVIGGNSDN